MSQNRAAVCGVGAIVLVGVGFAVYNGEKEASLFARAMYQGSSCGRYRIKRSGEGKAKEVRGLQNVGNTCFINVVLQSLASISPFVRYLQVCEGDERRSLFITIHCLCKQTSRSSVLYFLSQQFQFSRRRDGQ